MTAAAAVPFADEDAFQSAVVEAAKMHRCLCYHTHDSRRSEKGFPDLVIVGRRGILYRELKMLRKQTTPEQEKWLTRLNAVGQSAAVWRPEHWPTQILAEIRAVAR